MYAIPYQIFGQLFAWLCLFLNEFPWQVSNIELQCIFLGKKAIIITSLFQGRLKEKLARKARVNTERVYRIVLMPPWASHNTP